MSMQKRKTRAEVPPDNVVPLKAEHSPDEDHAPEPVWWMAAIQAVIALTIALFVAVFAPTYAVSMVPDWFPPRAIIAAAVLGLVAAVFLSKAALWLPEPLFVLARRLPSDFGFVRHERALLIVALLLAVGGPIAANCWRPQEIPPFVRAATARSAQPAQITSPAPAVTVHAPESNVAPLLHHLKRLHLAAKPAPQRRNRQR